MKKDYIKLLNDYVYQNLGKNKLSIKNAQEFIGCSRSILTEHCKNKLGMTPGKLFLKYKKIVMIDKVENLEGGDNLDVNYAFYSGFCRAFKKIHGITPSEYRKSLLCEEEENI
jgi:two-component system, response regulator YesN